MSIGEGTDWRKVENLAENYPYVVAILSVRNEYMCTGFSLNERTVVTAGSCLSSNPGFVALAAVLGDDIVGKNLLAVSHTQQHSDYSYYVSNTEPSETIINSNIALVYIVKNALNYFAEIAVIGDFDSLKWYRNKLEVIGYGEVDSGAVALQRQLYIQKTCVNPQWYYCICGVESSIGSTYEKQFGEGGPVVLEGKVLGIAATPCGALFMPTTDEKYNIFTVVMGYSAWISSNPDNATSHLHKLEAQTNNGYCITEISIIIGILLIIDNIIN